MFSVRHELLTELGWCILAALCTHLIMCGGQTLLHRWLGHSRLGGKLFRNHIEFHHAAYARGHLVSAVYLQEAGNNTPYFLIPVVLLGSALYFVLPLFIFLSVAVAASASFYAHVYFDKAYHVEGALPARFAWFRRRQQLHFVHHIHANTNYAIIGFFWDRLLGTFREPDRHLH